MSALEELTEIASGLLSPAVADWKARGKKVVGFFCSHVPEEILYAAGILPYRIRAFGCAHTTSADIYMSQVNCTFVRCCLEFALEGKYQFLDGLVFTRSCDHIRRLYDLLRELRPTSFSFLHFVDVPNKVSDEAIALFKEHLVEFKEQVERSFGTEITDASLTNAIDVYNETRSLLRRLYELREAEKPTLTGAQSLKVLLAGSLIGKEQYNRLLRRLLEELSEREGMAGYRARLMMAGGGGCDEPAYLEIMEDLGGLIVSDSICFGSRCFWQPVQVEDDPMLGLAKSYLDRPSCPRMVDKLAERSEFVKEMVERSRADGVVFQRIRYCDLWGGEQLHIRKALREANIPLLTLEREYTLGTIGQLKTRLQAFLEMLER